MKKIIAIALLGCSMFGYSQVIIGDELGATTEKTSVLLEFAEGNKGIILPYVTTLPNSPTPGTIALDATTGSAAKVVYYNGQWVDLSSNQRADVTIDLEIQKDEIEATDSKLIIGAETSTADGILVLESQNKAMILPRVSKTDEIVNPSPGMMAYLTEDKLLAVFNGSKWTFWAAKEVQ